MRLNEDTNMRLNEIFSQKLTEDILLGWEPPVNIMEKDWQIKIENDIIKAIKSYDIDVNKEELIKALNYDRNQYKAGYKDALKWMQTVIKLNIPNIIGYSENQDTRMQFKNINDYIDLRLKQLFESED
jgi:hypothetical protein